MELLSVHLDDLVQVIFDLDRGDAVGEESGDLRGLAMVCFAEAMRAVDPLPELLAEVLVGADEVGDDIVCGTCGTRGT